MYDKFLVAPNEYLLACPLCENRCLYIYNKYGNNTKDCVCCEECRYFNTLDNWNTGTAERAWDGRMMRRIRFLERISGLSTIADQVEDRRIKKETKE